MPHLKRGNFLDDLIQFARLLPHNLDCYTRNPNPLRDFLLDLGDCYSAMTKALSDRRDALRNGKPAPERAATPAGHAATPAEAHDAEDGK